MITRKNFIAAAGAATAVAAFAGGAKRKLNLTLGILSDIHIKDERHTKPFAKALEYFRDAGVDGVIISGDMADRGLVSEMELVGKTWFEVFPGNKAPDGRTVEKLFIYGNHDVQGHKYNATAKMLLEKYPDEAERNAQAVASDPGGVWERTLKETWDGIYAKRVKGYVFVGAHWGHEKKLKEFLEKNSEKLGLKDGKPFFYAQHQHPGNTVYGSWAWGNDWGRATRVLEKYPNAVAFSGHSHHSVTDERSVWQGAFTSIGASSLSYIYAPTWRENGEDNREDARVKQMPMLPVGNGKQGLVMRVYDDAIEFERREFVTGERLGPDWVLPLKDADRSGFEKRKASAIAPEFASGAKVEVKRVSGKDRKKVETEQVRVDFPAASASSTSRVYDYEVQAIALRDDTETPVCVKRVMSESFYLPASQETDKAHCVFALGELPAKTNIRFEVRPFECFGNKGAAIASAIFKTP